MSLSNHTYPPPLIPSNLLSVSSPYAPGNVHEGVDLSLPLRDVVRGVQGLTPDPAAGVFGPYEDASTASDPPPLLEVGWQEVGRNGKPRRTPGSLPSPSPPPLLSISSSPSSSKSKKGKTPTRAAKAAKLVENQVRADLAKSLADEEAKRIASVEQKLTQLELNCTNKTMACVSAISPKLDPVDSPNNPRTVRGVDHLWWVLNRADFQELWLSAFDAYNRYRLSPKLAERDHWAEYIADFGKHKFWLELNIVKAVLALRSQANMSDDRLRDGSNDSYLHRQLSGNMKQFLPEESIGSQFVIDRAVNLAKNKTFAEVQLSTALAEGKNPYGPFSIITPPKPTKWEKFQTGLTRFREVASTISAAAKAADATVAFMTGASLVTNVIKSFASSLKVPPAIPSLIKKGAKKVDKAIDEADKELAERLAQFREFLAKQRSKFRLKSSQPPKLKEPEM